MSPKHYRANRLIEDAKATGKKSGVGLGRFVFRKLNGICNDKGKSHFNICMLSTYFKAAFSNQSVMAPLRDAAKTLAKEFFDEGMKEYFTRWGDNVYDEGLTIKDDKLFKEYTQRITADLEAIKRQATIQKLYHDVKID